MSASLAAPDGTVLATVTRHSEPPSSAGGATVTITVTGSLDRDTCDLLEMALTSAVDAHDHVRCDMSGLDFLAAAGVGTVLAAHHRALRRGHRLSVRGVHGIARRVLHLAGVLDVLLIEE